MSIVTISRGTFGGGTALAERLSQQLGYACLSREVVYDAAKGYGVSEDDLVKAMESAPSRWQRIAGVRRAYLTYVQAALCERALADNLVYHGYASHLLLPGVSHVVRVRVIADMAFRIASAMSELNLKRKEAIAHIRKVDAERARWTQFLYGVRWDDPSLYDAVLNLGALGLASASDLVAHMTRLPEFQPTVQSLKAMRDLALGSRVRAMLFTNERTAAADLTVDADDGVVTISGATAAGRLVDAAREIAGRVEGVKEVRYRVARGEFGLGGWLTFVALVLARYRAGRPRGRAVARASLASVDMSALERAIRDLTSEDGVARARAREYLVELGEPAVDPLVRALLNPTHQVRWEATKALCEMLDPAAAPALVRALEDEEFDVRWLAAEGLIDLGYDAFDPLLHELTRRSASIHFRQGAHHVLRAFAKTSVGDWVAPVLAALESRQSDITAPGAAWEALSTLDERREGARR